MKVWLLSLLVICSVFLKAQDTLYLMNGKTKIVHVESMDDARIKYRKIKKNGSKGRKRSKMLENVFAVKYANGEHKQVYTQDTLIDNFLTIAEMKMYMAGLRDGRKHTKPWGVAVLGFGVGATGAAVLGGFWGLVPAGAYPFGAGLSASSRMKTTDPQLIYNEYYKSGYLYGKKVKKARWGLIGSGSGYVISIATMQYLINSGLLTAEWLSWDRGL